MPAIAFNRDFYNNSFSAELEKLITSGDGAQQILRHLENSAEDVLTCRIEQNLLTAYWEGDRKVIVDNKPINATLYKDHASKNGVIVLTFQGKHIQKNRVELNYKKPVALNKTMDFLFRSVEDSEDDNALDFFHLPVEYCDLV